MQFAPIDAGNFAVAQEGRELLLVVAHQHIQRIPRLFGHGAVTHIINVQTGVGAHHLCGELHTTSFGNHARESRIACSPAVYAVHESVAPETTAMEALLASTASWL